MNRAERRRQKKHAEKKQARYVFTKDTLDAYVAQEVEKVYSKKIAEAKDIAIEAATDHAMLLLFALPCEVLKNHYWVKTHKKKLPEFMSYLLDYYEKWKTDQLTMEEIKTDLWEYGGIKFEEVTK